ncbi:hypothetical protein FJP69_14255 [Stenotrophomonas maltophilia]|nr:hypothetical protein FJP69_14255 [Stenotrophomonas maltophilia]
MHIMARHRQRVARACNPVWQLCCLRLPVGVALSLLGGVGRQSVRALWRAVRGGLAPAGVSQSCHRYCNHAPSAALAQREGGPLLHTQGRRHDFFALSLSVRHTRRRRRTPAG